MNTISVDSYLKDGCGRCEHYRTSACKVNLWNGILPQLRKLVLEEGLVETMKWGSPCYMLDRRNVVMIGSFRDFCALQFFEGASIDDCSGLLEAPGPNSHHARYLKFRSSEELSSRRAHAQELLRKAMEVARQPSQRLHARPEEPIPDELVNELIKNSHLRKAFHSLTPGRRRSHILHIQEAKQSATRMRRVEKCMGDILAGRGFNERV